MKLIRNFFYILIFGSTREKLISQEAIENIEAMTDKELYDFLTK